MPLPSHSIAESCLVCSGPLHTTWLGSAILVLASLYALGVLASLLTLIDFPRPLRGAAWWVLGQPFVCLGIALRVLATAFLPPARRPKSRADLEARIRELEQEVGV